MILAGSKRKRERERERERQQGNSDRRKERKDSFASLPLSAYMPAILPSNCPSSLFILAAFYPAGMINGFTEASLSSTPLPPGARQQHNTRGFSAFLRAGLPLPFLLPNSIQRLPVAPLPRPPP